MITVEGKYGIKATILAHSISEAGVQMYTYEIEYPRLVLAEANTHRMLSKNSFSSRAVPFTKMVEQLNGRPVRFGANQGGMQDKGEDFDGKVVIEGFLYVAFSEYLYREHPYVTIEDLLDEGHLTVDVEIAWDFHRFLSVAVAGSMHDAGYHKQTFNRLTEAHQMMKTVISGTEWCNFFWLRDHGAADPTLAELARVMREAKEQSKPELLKAGQWHLPYIDIENDVDGGRHYYIADDMGVPVPLTLEQAIKVSCARCAAVSYRNEGYDLAKSLEVYDRLVGDDRKHASAFEHQATPMQLPIEQYAGTGGRIVNAPSYPFSWQEGISHMDRNGQLWSGNLRGFIQYRKTIAGENYTGE